MGDPAVLGLQFKSCTSRCGVVPSKTSTLTRISHRPYRNRPLPGASSKPNHCINSDDDAITQPRSELAVPLLSPVPRPDELRGQRNDPVPSLLRVVAADAPEALQEMSIREALQVIRNVLQGWPMQRERHDGGSPQVTGRG